MGKVSPKNFNVAMRRLGRLHRACVEFKAMGCSDEIIAAATNLSVYEVRRLWSRSN